MHNKILILDFGSQVTKLIARRIRELGYYSIIVNHDISFKEFQEIGAKAIILSGGPASVNSENAPEVSAEIINSGLPIFAICYGQQYLTKFFGGKVEKTSKREFGKAELEIKTNDPIFTDYAKLSAKQQVWMSHGDAITKLADNFKVIANTEDAKFAFIADTNRKIYATQFHPEVTHSILGFKLLENFLSKIANIKADWNMHDYVPEAIVKLKEQIGDKKVICGLSGGVDSSVAAALINKAIGKNLHCIFVDTGLLRKGEGKQVEETFTKNFKVNFTYVDASELFLKRLENISDPEQKRKIIGRSFIEIFDAEAKKIKDADFLAQGTLYPDVIESAHPKDGSSVTIKSHHNVGGLPEKMKLKLVEPLRELFKDEVRELGRELGLNDEIVNRHPFPGPGLAIRIPGSISKEKVKTLQEADFIYIEELKKHNLYDKIWQAFSVLLPVKTVGVMGDSRTYENVLALRAVTSSDGMTADFYPFSMEFLGKVANRIINEVNGINRVTYDITSKPPGTIEWE